MGFGISGGYEKHVYKCDLIADNQIDLRSLPLGKTRNSKSSSIITLPSRGFFDQFLLLPGDGANAREGLTHRAELLTNFSALLEQAKTNEKRDRLISYVSCVMVVVCVALIVFPAIYASSGMWLIGVGAFVVGNLVAACVSRRMNLVPDSLKHEYEYGLGNEEGSSYYDAPSSAAMACISLFSSPILGMPWLIYQGFSRKKSLQDKVSNLQNHVQHRLQGVSRHLQDNYAGIQTRLRDRKLASEQELARISQRNELSIESSNSKIEDLRSGINRDTELLAELNGRGLEMPHVMGNHELLT